MATVLMSNSIRLGDGATTRMARLHEALSDTTVEGDAPDPPGGGGGSGADIRRAERCARSRHEAGPSGTAAGRTRPGKRRADTEASRPHVMETSSPPERGPAEKTRRTADEATRPTRLAGEKRRGFYDQTKRHKARRRIDRPSTVYGIGTRQSREKEKSDRSGAGDSRAHGERQVRVARRGLACTTRRDDRGDRDIAGTAEAARSGLETHKYPHRPACPGYQRLRLPPPPTARPASSSTTSTSSPAAAQGRNIHQSPRKSSYAPGVAGRARTVAVV